MLTNITINKLTHGIKFQEEYYFWINHKVAEKDFFIK